RSGFIGLVIGLILYFLIFIFNTYGAKSVLFKTIILVILVGFFIPFLINNANVFDALLQVDVTTGGDQVRINLIKNGLYFLENSMFLGVGLGNIEYHMLNNKIYY